MKALLVFFAGFIHLSSWSQKLILSDDFNGTELNTGLWKFHPGFGPNMNANADLCTFRKENVVLENGILGLRLNREPGCYDTWQFCNYDSCIAGCTKPYRDSCSGMPVRCNRMEGDNKHCLCLVPKHFDYTAGMIFSQAKFLYGTFEVRCKVPKGGYPAFWLYGECCEEIDVFEFLGADTRKFTTTIQECAPDKCAQSAGGRGHFLKGRERRPGSDFSEDFHVWKLEWTPDHISVFVDGRQAIRCAKKGFGACNPSGIFQNPLYPDGPMNVIVNIAARKDSPVRSVMEVDYVKIWEWGGESDQ